MTYAIVIGCATIAAVCLAGAIRDVVRDRRTRRDDYRAGYDAGYRKALADATGAVKRRGAELYADDRDLGAA